MCFVDENGFRTLTSRKFLYLTTNRTYLFNRKKYDRTLSISLNYDDGEFNLKFVNMDTKEENVLSNPKPGEYTFNLEKGHGYKLILTSKKACGNYRISMRSIK